MRFSHSQQGRAGGISGPGSEFPALGRNSDPGFTANLASDGELGPGSEFPAPGRNFDQPFATNLASDGELGLRATNSRLRATTPGFRATKSGVRATTRIKITPKS